MQLKNNQKRNVQFFFVKKDDKGQTAVDFVHIPGLATVELDDDIFKALTASKTQVEVMREVEQKLDDSNIGADIKTGKDVLTVKEYYSTGELKTVNLVEEAIKRGELTVVARVKVSMADINSVLTENGVDIKDMPDDIKQALYDKLV